MVLVLIACGFAAGVYVGVSMTRSRSIVPTTREEPSPSRAPIDTRRTYPVSRSPTPPSAGRRAPATNTAPAPAADRAASAPVATVGILNIDSDVPGAQVFVDREFVGAAPVAGHQDKTGAPRGNVAAAGFWGGGGTNDVFSAPRAGVMKM